MSVRIAPNVSTDGTQTPGVVPTLLLDEEDAWVELRLSEENLREVVAALVNALRGHAASGDLTLIRSPFPTRERYEALARVCETEAVREALTFRLDPGSTSDLDADLINMLGDIDNLERCQFVARECDNLCEPGHTLCSTHEGN